MYVYISSGFLIDMLIGLCFLSHSDNLSFNCCIYTIDFRSDYIVGFMSKYSLLFSICCLILLTVLSFNLFLPFVSL